MKANARAIIQSFVLPTRKLKKTAKEAEVQYKSEYFRLPKYVTTPVIEPLPTIVTMTHNFYFRSRPRSNRDVDRLAPGGLQVIWNLPGIRGGECQVHPQ